MIIWLWAAITPVQNLQISKTTTFSESSGRQLSDELLGRPLASILSDRRPLEFFLRTDTQKHKKLLFFAFGQITRDFDTCSYIQGTTMWKLTSWGFQKCIIYRSGELPRRSYSPSKMEESEKNGPSPKISGVTKKEICHNNENWVSKRIAPQDNPIGSWFYSFQASILIIFALLFFCDADFFFEISPDFDSQ